MNKKVYPVQLIEAFVDEWEKAPSGLDSFNRVCSKYPEEFRDVWLSVSSFAGMGWRGAKEYMIEELHTSRTKLGRLLK